jgi:two-component system, OmpR family, response regulator MtrA
VSERHRRSRPRHPTPAEDHSFVILVGEAARDQQRIGRLLDAGSLVLLAPSIETFAVSLPPEAIPQIEAEPPHVLIRVNNLELDLTERRARWSGKSLDLTEYELNILACLADDPGRAWTFSELLSKVWGGAVYTHPDVVHAAVKRLRRKLTKAGADLTIQSVRGVGFRLAAPTRLQRVRRTVLGRRNKQ